MPQQRAYLMENDEEIFRLEVKTIQEEVRRQAVWCGIRPGMRVLDVGCGTGKTTSMLQELVQPGGCVSGIDYSVERIAYAKEHYGNKPGIDFAVCNMLSDLTHLGKFDLIWVRFILEYYLAESFDIVGNLKKALNPGGVLCLIDLDYNCLIHYELPPAIENILPKLMEKLQKKYNFDAFAGRKLYSYLYDHGFENIQAHMTAHHLIYGNDGDNSLFNWMKKIEVNINRFDDLLTGYPGGNQGFIGDFKSFFQNPRRFTYTPLILCKGRVALS